MDKYLGYLIIYSFTDFINGIITSAPGPLIPFLAANAHLSATSYYFVFISGAFGSIVGALVYKILENKEYVSAHHKNLGIISILYVVTLFIFEFWNTPLAVAILVGLYLGFYYISEVALNCAIMMVPSLDKIQSWFSISTGFFGLGCVAGPLLVYFSTVHTFTIIGVLMIPLAIFYLFALKSVKEIEMEKNQQSNEQEIINIEDSKATQQLPLNIAIFLGINLFLVVGLQSIIGGQIATFSYMTGIASKKQATLFVVAFWGTQSISRFASGLFKISVTSKLSILTSFSVLSAILSIVFSYFNYQLLATSLCAVFQGVSLSGVYPLSLSIPSQYGFRLTQQQISLIMIVMLISDAVIVAPTGALMQSINLQFFFWSLLFFSIILLINSRHIISLLEEEAKQKQLKEQIQERQTAFRQKQQIIEQIDE